VRLLKVYTTLFSKPAANRTFGDLAPILEDNINMTRDWHMTKWAGFKWLTTMCGGRDNLMCKL
jgi:hypothetical protein